MSRYAHRFATRSGRAVDTVVVGAGQAGLAMSRCLAASSVDHVVLERGEVANSWRRERWDSLRLLTPNWAARLPGFAYQGEDPDGFMSSAEVAEFIDCYAAEIAAPVRTATTVTAVEPIQTGYRVVTDRGHWLCRTVVMASGAFNQAAVPAVSEALPSGVTSLTSMQYRNPEQLEDGRVLVVGGSATGLQLADEIHRSGRPVTLAVGEHIRVPRRYRGRDVFWWLTATGIHDQRYDEVDDIARARRVPSPQLAGSSRQASLDLNVLQARGVEIVGRLVGVDGNRAQFSGSLLNHCAMADLKLKRLLDSFDAWAEANPIDTEGDAGWRPEATRLEASPRLSLDFASERTRSVVWATGFRPDHSWLHAPAFDHKGRIRHDGGVVAAPGIYLMGLPFLRRRKSSFIHGVGDDAHDLSAHLIAYLRGRPQARVVPLQAAG